MSKSTTTKMKKNKPRERSYVENRKVFTASNIFSEYAVDTTRYIVYSYGLHWPLFIYDEGVWYENVEKASQTTSKHATQCRPMRVNITPMDRNSMVMIAHKGIEGLAAYGPVEFSYSSNF